MTSFLLKENKQKQGLMYLRSAQINLIYSQGGLELLILLPSTLECWNYIRAPPCQALCGIRGEIQGSCILGRHSTN